MSTIPQALHMRKQSSDGLQKEEHMPTQGSKASMHFTFSSPISSNFSTKHSNRGSEDSDETKATSIATDIPLPALQEKSLLDEQALPPLDQEDLDPGSFDLVAPVEGTYGKAYSLEVRSEQLFSKEHLKIIFGDAGLLLRFTAFLSSNKPQSIPLLVYYLDAIKALKAIAYANAIAEALEPLEGYEFSQEAAEPSSNEILEEKADQAFEGLVKDDLPDYISYIYTQTVSLSISRRICGTLPVHLREASEGLAEVFCLTDPSRPDNPIVFASEEFYRTTQYGMSYVFGRNCRFLQGPRTNPNSVKRVRESIAAGKEHCEVFLNYRRDGSPFMNLQMTAPLCDSRGKIRYFIGAQVDVSGLVKECSDIESLQRLVAAQEHAQSSDFEKEEDELLTKKDELKELSEMLNAKELDTVRKWGGRMHREQEPNDEQVSSNWKQPRLLISNRSPENSHGFEYPPTRIGGKLSGVYEHYFLVRPYPSLRILFASPSQRVPGILQSPFLSKIGGSLRVREELTAALADGRGVTAKIRWVTKTDVEGRNRWIHCTPLMSSNGAVGVWMVVMVDNENDAASAKRFRQAPPVDPRFGRPSPVPEYDNVSLRDYAVIRSQGMLGTMSRPQSSATSSGRPESSRSQFDNVSFGAPSFRLD